MPRPRPRRSDSSEKRAPSSARPKRPTSRAGTSGTSSAAGARVPRCRSPSGNRRPRGISRRRNGEANSPSRRARRAPSARSGCANSRRGVSSGCSTPSALHRESRARTRMSRNRRSGGNSPSRLPPRTARARVPRLPSAGGQTFSAHAARMTLVSLALLQRVLLHVLTLSRPCSYESFQGIVPRPHPGWNWRLDHSGRFRCTCACL